MSTNSNMHSYVITSFPSWYIRGGKLWSLMHRSHNIGKLVAELQQERSTSRQLVLEMRKIAETLEVSSNLKLRCHICKAADLLLEPRLQLWMFPKDCFYSCKGQSYMSDDSRLQRLFSGFISFYFVLIRIWFRSWSEVKWLVNLVRHSDPNSSCVKDWGKAENHSKLD
jgi:hypothetical protein